MPELEPLRARATLDAGQALQGFAQLRASAVSFQGALAAGSAALATFAVAFSVRQAIEFESAMAGVAKTVDATADELAALGREFTAMSERIPVTRNELAELGEIAGQLGVRTENIAAFTETMAALGVTTNLAGALSATALARLSNIMGTSQSDFDRLGSVIVDLGNNLATTEAEIVEMGLRIAGAGRVIGLTEAEVLALAGALSSVGIEAEAGGTAISRVFLEMQSAVAEGGATLEAFATIAGTTGQEFARTFGADAAGAITQFVEGLNRVIQAGQDVSPLLEEIGLNNIRVRDALLRSAQAAGLLRESLDRGATAWRENTALTAEAERRYATTESQLAVLGQRVENLAGDFGETLLPVLNSLVDAFEIVLDVLRPILAVFRALPGPLRTTLAAVAALTPIVLAGAAAWNIYAASAARAGAAAGGAGILGAFNALGVRIGQLGARLGPLIRTFAPLGIALLATTEFFKGVTREVDDALGPLQRFNDEIAETTTILEDLVASVGDASLRPLAIENALRRVGELRHDLDVTLFLLDQIKDRDIGAISDPRFGGRLVGAEELRQLASDAQAALAPLEEGLARIFAGPPGAPTGGDSGKGLGEIRDRTIELRDALAEFERTADRLTGTPLFQLLVGGRRFGQPLGTVRQEVRAIRSELLEAEARAADAATAFEKMFTEITTPGEEGKQKVKEFGATVEQTIGQISAIASGVLNLANAFGLLGDSAGAAGRAIQGAIGGAATGAQIGGLPGAVGGGILGFIGGLFGGESEADRRRREEQGRLVGALDDLRGAVERAFSIFSGIPSRIQQVLEEAFAGFEDPARRGVIDIIRRRAQQQQFIGDPLAFVESLRDAGLTLADLRRIADETGLELDDLIRAFQGLPVETGELTDELIALGRETTVLRTAFEAFLETIEGGVFRLRQEAELFDRTLEEQADALRRFILANADLPSEIARELAGLDLSTAEGIRRAEEIVEQIARSFFAGQFDFGEFSPQEFLDALTGFERFLDDLEGRTDGGRGTGFVVSRTFSDVQGNQLLGLLTTLSVQADQSLVLARERNTILADMRTLLGGGGFVSPSALAASALPPSALAVPADSQIPVVVGNIEIGDLVWHVQASGIEDLRSAVRQGGEDFFVLIDRGLGQLRSRSQEALGHRRIIGRN